MDAVTGTTGPSPSAGGSLPGKLCKEDFECPICLSVLQDPFVTSCGHTFCYSCISQHIQGNRNCPCCAKYISKDHVFPNFLLGKVVGKAATLAAGRTTPFEQVHAAIADDRFECTAEELDTLLQALQDRKNLMEERDNETNMQLLLQFLQYSREEKAKRLQRLNDELSCLERDIDFVRTQGLASKDTEQQSKPGLAHPELQGRAAGTYGFCDGTNTSEGSGNSPHTATESSNAAAAAAAAVGLPAAAERASKKRRADALREADGASLALQQQQLGSSLAVTAANSGSTAAAGARQAPAGSAAVVLAAGVAPSEGQVCHVCEEHDEGDDCMDDEKGRVKRQRMTSQFEDLQRCYLELRTRGVHPLLQARAGLVDDAATAAASCTTTQGSPAAVDALLAVADGALAISGVLQQQQLGAGQSELLAAQAVPASSGAAEGTGGGGGSEALLGGGVMDYGGLVEFSRLLSVFTSCSSLQVVGSVRCANSGRSTSILSSIEFDRDGELFATGGVGKRICVYNMHDILAAPELDTHQPVREVVTRSKLTSLSWNPYVKSHLISSDYEGVVSLWDITTSRTLLEYEAHERRVWSVDFCRSDPMMFVSGSDDGWVKVWSTKQPNSVADIDVKANVCCVEYNPQCSHEIAVGSADHKVHMYDLRNTREPLHLFSGHRKAVSYVRYMSRTEVASASTDGTLRLWDLAAGADTNPARTFQGHTNEKNFVGMSSSNEFLACGSETNEVFVYHKALGAPVARRMFEEPALAALPPDAGNQFISSVSWQPGTRNLVAANCQGFIKVMRLAS